MEEEYKNSVCGQCDSRNCEGCAFSEVPPSRRDEFHIEGPEEETTDTDKEDSTGEDKEE